MGQISLEIAAAIGFSFGFGLVAAFYLINWLTYPRVEPLRFTLPPVSLPRIRLPRVPLWPLLLIGAYAAIALIQPPHLPVPLRYSLHNHKNDVLRFDSWTGRTWGFTEDGWYELPEDSLKR